MVREHMSTVAAPHPTASAICRGVPISKWLFEELNTFVEVTGAACFYVARKEVHPGILKMWSHLRKFTLYFLHYRPGQHTEAQVLAAQQEIFQFGEYAEQHLHCKTLTCLVHRCYAHIPLHVLATMPGAFLREDWGERLVRRTKSRITGHSTQQAARASADVCLIEMGLRLSQHKHPGIDGPLLRIRPVARSRPSDNGDSYGVQLHQLLSAYTGEEGDVVCS